MAAIELLLEIGDVKGADRLYRERLANGAVFRHLPANHEGLRCALGFVGSPASEARCEHESPPRGFIFYLATVGPFASNAGDVPTARRFFEDATARNRAASDRLNVRVGLMNTADLDIACGMLAEAASKAQEVLDVARDLDYRRPLMTGCAWLAIALDRSGLIPEALQAFEEANRIQRAMDDRDLYSLGDIRWASLLLRLGLTARSRDLTERNLEFCQHNKWSADIARCDLLLAACDLADGRLTEASERLTRAESVMRRGQMIRELPQALIARADLKRRLGQYAEALDTCDAAIGLAAPRGFRIAQADGLALRARIRLDRARDDAALTGDARTAAVERP